MANIELKPASVFEQFAKINQIPRPSKHEEQMIAYLQQFAKDRNLDVNVDATGMYLSQNLLRKAWRMFQQ